MIGSEIRKARLAAKLSQELVARKAGIDRPHLSELEHDKMSPSFDTLLRICKAIGVSAAELVARVENAHPKAKKG
jgi:transcriptional regulator with XRE-family HTH domain